MAGDTWDEMRQANPVMRRAGVGATAVVLVDRSDYRVSLIVGADVAQDLYLAWDSAPALGSGILLKAGSVPLLLTLQDHGRLVRGPIWCISPGGAVTVSWAEALHPCACLQ